MWIYNLYQFYFLGCWGHNVLCDDLTNFNFILIINIINYINFIWFYTPIDFIFKRDHRNRVIYIIFNKF